MSRIASYFTFNGNCKEVMNSYKACLRGELYFQTVGESPLTEKLPQTMKDYILQATLKKGNILLMGTDMTDNNLVKGNTTATLIDCTSKDEVNAYYANLSEGGNHMHPLEETFWGGLFGGVTDRYGNRWLFHYKR
jgi:PhnB protein